MRSAIRGEIATGFEARSLPANSGQAACRLRCATNASLRMTNKRNGTVAAGDAAGRLHSVQAAALRLFARGARAGAATSAPTKGSRGTQAKASATTLGTPVMVKKFAGTPGFRREFAQDEGARPQNPHPSRKNRSGWGTRKGKEKTKTKKRQKQRKDKDKTKDKVARRSWKSEEPRAKSKARERDTTRGSRRVSKGETPRCAALRAD